MVLLFVAINSINLFAQNNNCSLQISGRILEVSNGEPVESASVFIKEIQKGVRTNAQGEFTIEGLCAGNYTLICQHLNHEAISEKINLQLTLQNKIIFLTCHTDTLHQAIIKSSRLHWEDVTVSNKIQGNDLFVSSGIGLGKALEKINGIYNLSTGNNISKPVIRGMHSNRVLIMNNELRQEGQQWGNEHAPEIDQYIAKEILVVKGAQTLKYGSDIIGGLILVNPKPMKYIDKNLIEVNLSGFSNGRALAFSSSIEGRIKQFKALSWRLQGTFRQAGNGKTPDYYLKNTGMKELNYSAALGYHKGIMEVEIFHSSFTSDIGIFAGSHIGNLSDLYAAFERDKPIDTANFTYDIDLPFQDIKHQISKVKLGVKFKKTGTLHLMYGFQKNIRKEFDNTLSTKLPDGTFKPALHFNLKTQNYDFCFEHKTIKRFEGSFGVNGFYQVNEYYGAYFIPNYQKFTGGFYWVEKWHKNALSIEGGIRYDINRFTIQKWEQNILLNVKHAYQGVAATIATRYQFPYFTLHVNAGTAWRAPFVNELYSFGVHHSAASFEIGDRNMVPERNYNTAITIDFNYKKKTDIEFTLFNNYIHNYINLQPQLPATLTIRGAFPTYRYSQTNTNFYGAEFSSSTPLIRNIVFHARTNITIAKDIKANNYLVGIPPARIESDIDIPLYNLEKKRIVWNMGASYTFKQTRVDDSMDYVAPPAAYFLVQTNITANLSLAKFPVQCNVGVSNLLNVCYRDYMNRNRYYADETGRNVYIRLRILNKS